MVAAIIGGTGMYAIKDLDLHEEIIKTPFGAVPIRRNDDLVFLNRHGPNHSAPPHKVNYRANIKALAQLGVKRVCATFAVGSINPDFALKVPVILDDFIDFSSGREHTFFDTMKNGVGDVDVSVPFCPVLSNALEKEVSALGLTVRRGGIYASTNGPRFESPAEIRAYRTLGADVVGMTLCPELPLALEQGMSYAGLAFSINWGAGMTPTIELVHDDIDDIKTNMLRAMINTLAATRDDQCTPARIL
ncbi:MAG: 5'-methylthioadenosine phosphorylase [Robiginitomaculum sp.]|nr:MAG: 5'-methylthioadenosine phosphorylase [Robiginitomaculum sp.]